MTPEELKAMTTAEFEVIVTDNDGSVMFGVPIPGARGLHYQLHVSEGGSKSVSILDDVDKWERAWARYIARLQTGNRSRKKALEGGAITKMPDNLALPSIVPYQNAMSVVENPAAHLQPIVQALADKLKFEDGVLYFEGMNASGVNLVQYYDKTPRGVSELDLPTLRALYSVIFEDIAVNTLTNPDEMAAKIKDPQYIGHSVKIYLNEFLKMLGYAPNSSEAMKNFAIAKIMSFNKVLGLLDVGRRTSSKYPVMLFMGYNAEDGTLSFSSPYINVVIMKTLMASIQTDKQGKPKLKRNGEPFMLPSHTFLVKSSIAKERNKRAAEIVCIVTTLIEQAGDNIPHIKARTIIDRCPDLKNALENAATSSDKGKILRRAFTKAWELLPKYTLLAETYSNIKFPTAIPTASDLNITFEFPHEGKIKKPRQSN